LSHGEQVSDTTGRAPLRNYSRRFRLLADLAVFDAGALTVFWLRFFSGAVPLPFGIPPLLPYLKLLLLADALWLGGALLGLAYQRRQSLEQALRALLFLYGFVCFGLLTFAFVYRSFTFSMTVVVSALLGALPLVMLVHARYRERRAPTRVALAGTVAELNVIIAQGRPPQGGMTRYHAALVIDAVPADAAWPVMIQAWSPAAALPDGTDEVWVTATVTAQASFPACLTACTERQQAVKLVPFLPGLGQPAPGLPLLTQLTPLNCLWHPLLEPHNRLLKRLFDLTVAGGALLLLTPVLAALALAVWWRDGSPVLIRQKRVSRNGRAFRMLKFRTMRLDAEEESGPVWAQADDPRCTPLGLFLRRTSLDELPQLWNVLTGEMSMIGPRPERPHFVRQFGDAMCFYDDRHNVQTGITGWAQANGLRGNTSIELRTLYDLYYIENWSVWFDLKIIVLTLREVLLHKPA